MPIEAYCPESQNIVKNLYYIALRTGRGITDIELSAGCSSGTMAMARKRNSSFTIRTALRLAKVVDIGLMELMKDPDDFRKEY